MADKIYATVTSKGQITLPIELRRQWDLRPGDQVAFEASGKSSATLEPRRRRSIFERLESLQLLSLGRPLTQEDIDEAVGSAMDEKYSRSKSGA